MGEEVLGGNRNKRNKFSETTEILKQKIKDLFKILERPSHRRNGGRTRHAVPWNLEQQQKMMRQKDIHPKLENTATRKYFCVPLQVYLTLSSET